MLTRELLKCKKFIAGDKTVLREILHPDKENLNIRYSLAHAVLNVGEKSTKHRLLSSSEVYYILSGEGLMHIGEESKKVHAGTTVYIPPKKEQYIENVGYEELAFLCIVDPSWRNTDEEIC